MSVALSVGVGGGFGVSTTGKHGRRGNMSKWISDLKANCPRRDAHSLHERCDVLCPDLPKVL
jgi:hypothetical protein